MWSPLHQLALEQGGVLLAHQATELGFTWHDLHALVVREGWHRLFRGAYSLPGVDRSPLVLARAMQRRQPTLIASHGLAAAAHRWGIVGPVELSFTPLNGSRVSVPSGTLYRWELDESEIVEVDGVLVTEPLRTAADMMRRKSRHTGVIAVDSGLRLGHLTLDAIADRLDRLGDAPGSQRAWAAFPILDPKAGAVTESKARLIMWDRNIYPQTQVPLPGADGKTYYADAVADGVVFESEGKEYHAGEQQHEDDVRRFNALAIAARGAELDFCRLTFRGLFLQERQTGDLIVRTIAARRRRLGRSG